MDIRPTPLTSDLSYPVTEEEIINAVNLTQNTSPGLDNISFGIIKLLPPPYYSFLANLFTFCIKGGDIPDSWKEGLITLIYKNGDHTECLNYRLITLLQVTYKLYSNIITNRLAAKAEKDILHKTQSGFRRGKSTLDSCRAYKDIIEHSIQKKKELHVAYIDIKKAFDSITWWQIKETLTFYNVDKTLIAAIMKIYSSRTAKLKINKQVSRQIHMHKGTAQGDPLSPLLFILCINPLLEWLSEGDNGYKLGNATITALAYCDDLVPLSHSKKGLQNSISKLEQWMNYYSIQINAKKSAYSNNSPNDTEGIKIQSQYVPTRAANETYPYLGILFNLQLNWDKQQQTVNGKYKNIIKTLKRKRLTGYQMAMAINVLATSIIAYSLGIVDYPKEWIRELDIFAAQIVRKKLRIKSGNDNAGIYTKQQQGGIGLSPLDIIQDSREYALTTNQLNNKTIAELTILHLRTTKTNSSTLNKWEIKLNETGHTIEVTKEQHPINKIKGLTQRTVNKLAQAGVLYLKDLTSQEYLLTPSELSTRTLQQVDIYTWQNLHNTLCQDDNSNLLNQEVRTKLHFLSDYNIQATMRKDLTQVTISDKGDILVFTDGSSRPDQPNPASGVFFAKKSPLNKTEGRANTSFIGELAAIKEALLTAPGWAPVTIVTDSLSSIQALGNNRKPIKQNAEGKDYLKRIRRIIRIRGENGQTVKLHHITSHIQEKKKEARKKGLADLELLKDKLRKQKLLYKKDFRTYVHGNEKADKLATQAYTSPYTFVREFGTGKERKAQQTTLKNEEKLIITSNLHKDYKEHRLNEIANKYEAYPARGALLRDAPHNSTILANQQKRKNHKNAATLTFLFKARGRYLPTRDQMYHRYYKGKGLYKKPNPLPPLSIGKKALTQHLAKQEVYADQLCLSCDKGINENVEHIYSGSCEAREQDLQELAEKVRSKLARLTEIPDISLNRMPLWIPEPLPPTPPSHTDPPEWVALKNFNKTAGMLGIPPLDLAKALELHGCRPDKAIIAANRITWTIAKNSPKLWHNRNQELMEHTDYAEIHNNAGHKLKRILEKKINIPQT